MLRVVEREGLQCALCPWYRFCRGCQLPCDDNTFPQNAAFLAIDWDPTALHLRYQTVLEKVSKLDIDGICQAENVLLDDLWKLITFFLTTLLPTGGLRACECGRNAPQTCGAYCTLGLLGGILFRGNPWVFLWQVQESPAGSQEVADLETTTNSSKIHLWSLLCLDAVFYFHDFWYWCMYLCYTLYMWVDECICLFDTPLSWNTLFLVE